MANIFGDIWLVMLSLASIARLSHAYVNGAPASACSSMIPGHGIAEQQPSAPPYLVDVNPREYTPGAVITVTINGTTDSRIFQGFLVQARRADPSLDTNQLLGSFTEVLDKAKFADCGGNGGDNALTHTKANDKGILSFTWKAPTSRVGHVIIVATIAERKNIFWVKVRSPVIRDRTAIDFTTPEPHNTTSLNPQCDNVTSSSPIVLVDEDTQCGNEVGCMRQCGVAGCKFVVAWKPLLEKRKITFLIQARVPAYDYYIAVGISEDSEMGMDTVLDCIKYIGDVKVQQSYNQGRDNHVYPGPLVGLTVLESSVVNDTITCKFELCIDGYKDLTRHWNLLVAHGDVNNRGMKMIHSDTRVSLTRVLLLDTAYDDVKEWGYTGEGDIGGGRGDSGEDTSREEPDVLTTPSHRPSAGHVCTQTLTLLLLVIVLIA